MYEEDKKDEKIMLLSGSKLALLLTALIRLHSIEKYKSYTLPQ